MRPPTPKPELPSTPQRPQVDRPELTVAAARPVAPVAAAVARPAIPQLAGRNGECDPSSPTDFKFDAHVSARLPAAFLGVDKWPFPPFGDRVKKTAVDQDPITIAWLTWLLKNSNLRILGNYVADIFSKRFLLNNFDALHNAGWGIGLFVVDNIGTKAGDKAKRNPKASHATGISDAYKIKNLIRDSTPSRLPNGAVLYFDLEPGYGNILNDCERKYFDGFFETLVTPDGDGMFFRPGLYAHQYMAAQLLQSRSDLFIWEVDALRENGQPGEPTILESKMQFPQTAVKRMGGDDPKMVVVNSLKAFEVPIYGSKKGWTAWPILRQWCNDVDTTIPPDEIPVPELGPKVPKTHFPTWDFNSSLVRHPSFPIAEPRLSGLTFGGTNYLATLEHVDPDSKNSTLPRGVLKVCNITSQAAPSVIETAPGSLLDSGAPLLSPSVGGVTPQIFTLLRGGIPARSYFEAGTWSPLTPLVRDALQARQPYAMGACAVGLDEMYMFIAVATGNRHEIKSLHRQGVEPWTVQDYWQSQAIHQCSNLAATACGETVGVIAINLAGKLAFCHWRRAVGPPLVKSYVEQGSIECQDTLLNGGALELVSTNSNEMLAFAIGQDLRLKYAIWRRASGWGASKTLESFKTLLCPHSSLNAIAVNPNQVELVVMGCEASILQLTLTRDGDNWKTTSKPVGVIGPGNGLNNQPAKGPNPLSDLVILPGSPSPLVAAVWVETQWREKLKPEEFAQSACTSRAKWCHASKPSDWKPFSFLGNADA